MSNIQLYLNDQLVDLSDDNPIALTFQINNGRSEESTGEYLQPV
ncbi:hypothetical protein [Mucilaginibacter humi]|nr:hypothetical protein [Mucilaginibacter humi]